MSAFDDVSEDEAVFIAKLALEHLLQAIMEGRKIGAEISLMRNTVTDQVRFEITGPGMTRDQVDEMIAAYRSGNDEHRRVLPSAWLKWS